MQNKIERIKTHIREHKKIYIGIAAVGGIIITFLGTIEAIRRGVIVVDTPNSGDTTNITNNTVNIKANKVWFTMDTNYLNIGSRDGTVGRPGTPVWDEWTNKVYRSIKDVSEDTGLSRDDISQAMRGFKNIPNHIFRDISIEAWNPDFDISKLDPNQDHIYN